LAYGFHTIQFSHFDFICGSRQASVSREGGIRSPVLVPRVLMENQIR
jgi:hypothetical protein